VHSTPAVALVREQLPTLLQFWPRLISETPTKLLIYTPDRWSRVSLGWDPADGQFLGWYVNFERPARATRDGIVSKDLVLDLYVNADGSWDWKDRDDFDEVIAQGVLDPELDAVLAGEARQVIRELDERRGAFDPRWLEFVPDRFQERPVLPEPFSQTVTCGSSHFRPQACMPEQEPRWRLRPQGLGRGRPVIDAADPHARMGIANRGMRLADERCRPGHAEAIECPVEPAALGGEDRAGAERILGVARRVREHERGPRPAAGQSAPDGRRAGRRRTFAEDRRGKHQSQPGRVFGTRKKKPFVITRPNSVRRSEHDTEHMWSIDQRDSHVPGQGAQARLWL